MSHSKKAFVLIALVALLLAVAVVATSCSGSKSAGSQQPSRVGTSSNTGNATIDGYVNELDKQMNSVDPGDFSDGQLSNSAVGQ